MFSVKRPRYRNRGFTLTETLIIVIVVGILAIIAAPSFGTMLDSIKVDQATTEIRVALSQAQRQAIRNRGICEAGISTNQYSTKKGEADMPSTLKIDCLPSEESIFSKKVIVATNMLPLRQSVPPTETESSTLSEGVARWCKDHKKHNHSFWADICIPPEKSEPEDPKLAQVAFGQKGIAQFHVKSNVENPPDPSGKIVVYRRGNEKSTLNCLAVSRRLGLTRIGSYRGNLDQSNITNGNCSAQEWNKQL